MIVAFGGMNFRVKVLDLVWSGLGFAAQFMALVWRNQIRIHIHWAPPPACTAEPRDF